MKISTTSEQLVQGVGRTVVSSHLLDVGSEIEFWTYVMKLLFDDADQSTDLDNKNS